MPRVKIGTILDQQLIRRARLLAERENKNLNQVIEEALAQYLERGGRRGAKNVVRSSRASIPAEPALVKTILEEESFLET